MHFSLLKSLALSASTLLLSAPVFAASTDALPLYVQECGACHVPYPSGMLPAASWARLIPGLSQHFGVDASLEPASAQAIGDWLQAHAASNKRMHESPPQDRITHARWFIDQHDEVSGAVWKRKSVGSPSNCAACHPGAASGHFSENQVHIPK